MLQRGFQLQQRHHQHERNRDVQRGGGVALARHIPIQLHDLCRVLSLRRPDLQDEVVLVDLRRMLGKREREKGFTGKEGESYGDDGHENYSTWPGMVASRGP